MYFNGAQKKLRKRKRKKKKVMARQTNKHDRTNVQSKKHCKEITYSHLTIASAK